MVAQPADAGQVEATGLTKDVLHDWDPAAALLIGIAASTDPDQIKLGDVVVGKSIWYFESGKVTSEGTKPQPEMMQGDAGLLKHFTGLADWDDVVGVARPDGTDARPNVHQGVIASGEKVIADVAARDHIAAGQRKIIAITMEDYGFSRAISQSQERVQHLVIRGICDDATSTKNDKWHSYAAAAAAVFTRHFLLDRPLDPRSAAGQRQPGQSTGMGEPSSRTTEPAKSDTAPVTPARDQQRSVPFASPGNTVESVSSHEHSLSVKVESVSTSDVVRDTERRHRDVQTLSEAMSFVHIPTLDRFVSDLGIGYMSRTIFTIHAGFEEVVSSSLFHLYDGELSSRVARFQASWNASLNFGAYFFSAGDHYNFGRGGDDFLTPGQQAVWKDLQEAADDLQIAFRELLQFIRDQYMEVDLAQTSAAAGTGLIEVERMSKEALTRRPTSGAPVSEPPAVVGKKSLQRSVEPKARRRK